MAHNIDDIFESFHAHALRLDGSGDDSDTFLFESAGSYYHLSG